jgi:hypothetical protein
MQWYQFPALSNPFFPFHSIVRCKRRIFLLYRALPSMDASRANYFDCQSPVSTIFASFAGLIDFRRGKWYSSVSVTTTDVLLVLSCSYLNLSSLFAGLITARPWFLMPTYLTSSDDMLDICSCFRPHFLLCALIIRVSSCHFVLLFINKILWIYSYEPLRALPIFQRSY